jgi:hypothetical protein
VTLNFFSEKIISFERYMMKLFAEHFFGGVDDL